MSKADVSTTSAFMAMPGTQLSASSTCGHEFTSVTFFQRHVASVPPTFVPFKASHVLRISPMSGAMQTIGRNEPQGFKFVTASSSGCSDR